ncbi:LexA family transcriptional regulator [Bacillus sp. J14TS2]|uniref:LexA family protein n=1 Tax=Bacillus sp. J14TS2 TaxID=2807188 RepID=UPI001AFF0355|nr:LexA family transcriptional regulator [Bacillus sp. J14TS2]GIN73993.1 LexA family transcriptional regulator [Bacillus sp. J14TS2]
MDRDLPLKREIADNIKRIMQEKGISSQIRLSEVSGISKSTLSDYLNCKTLINPGNVEKLAEALGVHKYDIDPSFYTTSRPNSLVVREAQSSYGNTTTYEEIDNRQENISYIPVVGSIAAGLPLLAEQNIEGYMPTLTSFLSPYKKYFYLKINGDSMNLEFNDGSFVLVEKTCEVENGQIAAVRINGNEATVKKISRSENIITLIPLSSNPEHQPQTFDLTKIDLVIEGRIIQAVKMY